MPGILHSHNGFHGDVGKASDPFQTAADLFFFKSKLLLIGQSLKLAAAALAGGGAQRFHPVGGRLYDLFQLPVSVVFLCFHYFRGHHVADHSVLYKNSEAISLADAFTVSSAIHDLYCNPVVLAIFHEPYTSPVLLRLDSKSLLYPSQSFLPLSAAKISVSVSMRASVLSARFSATASASAGFLGEPYSSSP